MILISSCWCGGRSTAINYFTDPVTFEWQGKPRFAWNYTVAGRGDPYFTDEEFKNLTPGQSLWYDARKSYPNNESWTSRTLDEQWKNIEDYYHKHAGTLYDHLNGKYQIVSCELTDFIGLSWYARENSKELTTWWIDTPKEIITKRQMEKHGVGTQTIANDHSSDLYGYTSKSVRAITEEEAEVLPSRSFGEDTETDSVGWISIGILCFVVALLAFVFLVRVKDEKDIFEMRDLGPEPMILADGTPDSQGLPTTVDDEGVLWRQHPDGNHDWWDQDLRIWNRW